MRLHVGVFGTEQRFGTIDGELLSDVDMFAAAVVALARIALSVLIGQYRALRFQHGAAYVVFGSDQLDVIFLAAKLSLDRLPQHRIGVREYR